MRPPGRQSRPGANRAASVDWQANPLKVAPKTDPVADWLATFTAGAVVEFAAYQLEVLDLLPDEALRRIAAIGTDTAVSQAYWLLERRAA